MHDPNQPQVSSDNFSAHELIVGAHNAAYKGAYQGVLTGAMTLMLIYGAAQAAVFVVGYIRNRKAQS